MTGKVVKLQGRKRPAERGRLQREAYRRLREMIIRQELEPGRLVSEVTLGQRVGLGRSPVRVALRGLVADGLVSIIPQRGALISPIDFATELKVLEVRAELERLLVRGAAMRADAAQRLRMRGLAAALAAAAPTPEGVHFVHLLRKVHEVLTEAADNEFLTSVMDRIHALSRRFWYAHHDRSRPLGKSATLHAERLVFTADGDVVQAQAACDELVAYIEAKVRQAIRAAPDGREARANAVAPDVPHPRSWRRPFQDERTSR